MDTATKCSVGTQMELNVLDKLVSIATVLQSLLDQLMRMKQIYIKKNWQRIH